MTYKEDGTTPANTFSVGETIIVKATATFPANNAIMAAAEFDTPAGEQMAVYYDNIQISAPSTVENGVHTMTVDTSNLPESALNKEIALTVKYIESGNASGADTEAKVTVTAAARVEKDSTTTYVGALADAFTDGNSGATVTLLAEVNLSRNILISSSTFMLDLSGQTVKTPNNSASAFLISGGSLTIQDSGTGGKIESSNITIKVTDGTLSIKSGTVSGFYGVEITSGTVNISGGVISGTENGLWVNGGGNIVLSGGAYSGRHAIWVDANVSVTLKDLLASECAYHSGDTPIPLQPNGKELTGTVTVKECSHTGGLVPSENGYQHGGPCKCCGTELTAANHTLGADNQCSGCGAALAAKVEKSGSDTVYVEASGLADVFAEDSGNDGATITLLDNITTSKQINVYTDNLTLDLNGKTYTCTQNAFQIFFVSLMIKGSGAITTSGFYCLVVDEGTLNIESGSFSAKESAVYVVNDGILQLAGGSFTGEKSAIAYASGEVTGALANYGGADAPHYAFYQGSSPYTPSGRSLPSGTFIVQECQHKGVTPTSNNDGTHALKCPYCGYSEAAANCTYVFSGTTGTCAVCGDSVTVAVAADNLIYDGTEKKPGVTVMRAGTELTANTDYTVAYTDNTNAGTAKVTVTIGNSQGTYTGNFNIAKASLTITASAQTITYGGSITQGTGQVTSEGLCGGDTLESVTLTPSSDQVAVADKTITPSAAVIKRGGEDAAANYNITYQGRLCHRVLAVHPGGGTEPLRRGGVLSGQHRQYHALHHHVRCG